jgi:hydrogenase nickel incorporation protein HypB
MEPRIPETRVLRRNEQVALENRALLDARGVVAIHLMAAPGAGKTAVLERTLSLAGDAFRAAVIEGDLRTEFDAERIRRLGVRAFQVTTGTVCHLDARAISRALTDFSLHGVDTLFIENVGALVGPAEFDLGEHLRVMVYSIPEGADKPLKYPLMFQQAHCILLNKLDLHPYSGVSLEELEQNARVVNPLAPVFRISCRTGDGLAAWVEWLRLAVAAQRDQLSNSAGA